MRSRVSSIVILAFLSVSITIAPLMAANPTHNPDSREARTDLLQGKITTLLDEVNDKLGGNDLHVAQIKKYVTELVELSDERTRYNLKAAFAREHRKNQSLEEAYAECANLSDDELIDALHKLVDNHFSIGYREARTEMFSHLDNVDGYVECVYTGRKIKTHSIPNPSDMNCEHTWPQSQGATGVARTDMHHLFCTDSKANSIRSSLPFGNVSSPSWSKGGSKKGNGCFEVRKENRGNTARAKFYFSVRYGKRIGAAEEAVLKQWNEEDPVDEAELARNSAIEKIQKNRNPFVDHPEFVSQIRDF